eukprot:363393-Chlamydomonas_euryale.AAC.1
MTLLSVYITTAADQKSRYNCWRTTSEPARPTDACPLAQHRPRAGVHRGSSEPAALAQHRPRAAVHWGRSGRQPLRSIARVQACTG